MEINLVKLLDAFKERLECTITVELDNKEPALTFTKGHHSMNGGVSIYRSFTDLEEMLQVNKVYEKLKEIRLKDGPKNYEKEDKEMDIVIYDTLVKYILQMLSASLGRQMYEDIIPLERDKSYFWVGKIL